MATTIHRVQQGECLSSIARRYGLKDGETLLGLQSDAFQSERTANILLPGDEVEVPALVERQQDVATDQVHRMRVQRERMMLRLVVGDAEHDHSWGYELELGEQVHTGTADGNDLIEHRIPANVETATLYTWPADEGSARDDATNVTTWTVALGHLNPITELSGLQQRLRNLGLYHGEISPPGGSCDELDAATTAALQRLQTKLGLEPTGEYDDDTKSELQAHHDEQ